MSHLPTGRLRRWSLVLAVAFISALVVPAEAIAGAPGTTPTITAPADGATVVSSPLLVTADSTAAFVRFLVGGQGERTVAVSAGEAITEVPVSGLSGDVSLEAYDCDSLTSCAATSASITVDVNLKDPEITAPAQKDVVGNSVTVKVKTTWGGALQFYVDGSPAGKVLGPLSQLTKTISLKDRKDGDHVLSVQQCNDDGSVCEGGTDKVTVIKDTKAPKWTDVNASNGKVYPVKDNYKDSTQLSARVNENVTEAKVEIRKAGGPIVRTLKLGRVDAGRVKSTWNGRKSNGDIVPNGKYTFRFIGADKGGLVGKSNERALYVSDKKLEKRSATKTVTALSSFAGNGSGQCSDLFRLNYDKARFDWPKGIGYYSNVYCRNGSNASVALGVHVAGLANAPRYGSFSLEAYGAGAFRHAGPAAMLTIKSNDGIGAKKKLGTSLGWHGVKGLDVDKYLKKGKLRWAVGTTNGNWYDVKEFRISYTYFVLQ